MEDDGTDGAGGAAGGDDLSDVLDDVPVFNFKSGGGDDDDDDDDEDEEFDDDEEEEDAATDSDAESQDSDAVAARAAAVKKEENTSRAWGSKRAAFYDHDSEVEIDEAAAAEEEAEVVRLQRKRAAEMEEDDALYGAPLGRKVAPAAGGAGARAAAAAKAGSGGAAVAVVAKDLSGLSKAAKLELVAADTPELIGLLEDMKTQIAEIRDKLAPILAAVADGRIRTAKGLSYLEAKYQIMMAYVTDITFYLLLKAEGKSVADHPVIAQLVHIRTLLDKMRPLDGKMAPQVARLLRAARAAPGSADAEMGDSDDGGEAAAGAGSAAAGGTARRRGGGGGGRAGGDTELDDAIKALEGVEEEGHDAEITGGVYRPLRRTAVMYDDDPAAGRKAREEERRRTRVAKSAMMRDIRDAYSEAPEALGADGGADAGTRNATDDALDRVAREREEYEEEAFTRVAVSKEERKARKARERERARWDNLADLENIGDVDALLADEGGRAGGTALRGGRTLAQLESQTEAARARAARSLGGAGALRPAAGGAGARRGGAASDDDDDTGGLFGGDSDSDGGHGGRRGGAGSKRGRAGGRGGDDSGAEEDPFYAAVEAAAARKRAKKAAASAAAEEANRSAIRSAPDMDELHEGADGALLAPLLRYFYAMIPSHRLYQPPPHPLTPSQATARRAGPSCRTAGWSSTARRTTRTRACTTATRRRRRLSGARVRWCPCAAPRRSRAATRARRRVFALPSCTVASSGHSVVGIISLVQLNGAPWLCCC